MTRKHYQQIAATIAQHIDSDDLGRVRAATDIAEELAAMFKADNPNFDRKRFFRACGFTVD